MTYETWKKNNPFHSKLSCLVLLLLLFLGCYSIVAYGTQNIIARGQNFELYFENDQALCFQHLGTPFIVTIDIASGSLNGSNANLLICSDINHLQGDFSFTSQDSASLMLSCDNEDVKLLVNGNAYAGTFNIQTDEYVHIRWVLAWNIFVWTLPILGCVGAFCLIASPYYIVTQLRKKTTDSFLNAWMYGLLLFLLGLGLLICWLWS